MTDPAVERLPGEEDAAARAAERVAAAAIAAIAARGAFTVALSGGRTPWRMLEILARRDDVRWERATVFQTDERVAPEGDPDRNWTRLRSSFPVPATFRPMPVLDADLGAAARAYAALLESAAGRPPVLDLVHLGLGADGHTASLVPGDPALDVADADAAATGPYQGRRRLTLTFPAIDRARERLFLVTGAGKREALDRLLSGDRSIPAGRVRRDGTTVVAAAVT